MSDSNNTDARNDRGDVSRYAPRRHRVPGDEATTLPVRERPSRGESGGASQAFAQPADPIRVRRILSSSRLPLSATGRVAVAIGLVAAVTTVSAAMMHSKAERPAATDTAKAPPVKKDQAKVQTTELPRPVHTIAIRPQAATAPAAHADTAQALPDALKTWVMYPDPQVAQASASTTTDGSGMEDAKKSEPAKEADKKTEKKEAAQKPAHARHKAKAKHTARRHRRHRVRRRHVRTAAKPQAVQQAQAAAAPPATAEPTKKLPIQAAIDALFGGSGDSGASGGGSAPTTTGAPMTTGAAFQ